MLPEGPLRQWVADDRGVSLDREMELLAQVGHDLPGAIQVVAADGPESGWEWMEGLSGAADVDGSAIPPPDGIWRFSLAGVALKFSMLAHGDRLTVPAVGDRGDWLVKFPDYRYPDVPVNEHAMMSLARLVGIEVPDVRLLHRDELDGLPAKMWPGEEQLAYAVRRFDRSEKDRRLAVHIEDFAQIRDVYPELKYRSTFETVAGFSYRGHDIEALREFTRRLAFSVIIGNGDAHLKNWSLIYPDMRMPTLSPAYDLVSTPFYAELDGNTEDLGMKFCGSRRFVDVRLESFAVLQRRLNRRFGDLDANLAEIAAQTAERTLLGVPAVREHLSRNQRLRDYVTSWIQARAKTLLNG